jgi:M6 family metalloprotease-like protein
MAGNTWGFSAAGECLRTIAAYALILAGVLGIASGTAEGIVPPKHGGPLPDHFRELKEKSKSAFTFKHAWIERRQNQVSGDRRYQPLAAAEATMLRNSEQALRGRLAIPVVLGQYSEITEPPFTPDAFDREFFTGPQTPGTMRQYWREVSYNLFDVTGTVFDWVPLSQPEYYYTGGAYSGLDTLHSKTGDMIKEILDALDPGVDFGAFDNDGPDGVPNSGDDDGFVDVLLVIHPTYGAECDNSAHMWSHSWNYSSWPVSGGQPYLTNDTAAEGGMVRIDDYILAPSLSCETGIIEIGVICHELGHAFGLPDLYDYNGNSSGIGDWGLMGTGNWNTPASPAHLCAWSREQLGWVNPVEIDWRTRTLTLRPVGTSGDVAKLALPTVRFKRQLFALNNYALLCSYSNAEGRARQWPGYEGYGNGWNESVYHEFSVDASRPVTLQYDIAIDVESDYDFGRLLLEIGGAVDTVAVYTGSLSRRETIDLGTHLPADTCTFTLRFVFASDVSVSDEDGYYDSRAGYTFNIDNVHLDGGGLGYSADFELDSGGWRGDSEPAEYFIVENRRKTGFDANLHGQGIVIWHAENSIAYTYVGNSGGMRNTQARGLVLEEADGEYNLIIPAVQGGNFGDDGDPYPGSAGNRTFGPTTVPRSQTNGGVLTPVIISGIVQGTSTSSASFKGGMPPPSIQAVFPDTIDREHETQAELDIRGEGMRCGVGVDSTQAHLSLGRDTIRGQVTWLGEERIIAEFPIEELYAGEWDLTVTSGDGQASTAQRALAVVSIYASARVTAGRDNFLVEWSLKNRDGVRGCLLYRSTREGAFELVASDTLRGSSGKFSYQDYSVLPDVPYSYEIVTYLNGGAEERYVLVGPFSIAKLPFMADQNYPNPFNEKTTVSFFVPAPMLVSVDIYDVSGRLVERLVEREYGRGTETIPWAPAKHGTAAGMYFCVFQAGNVTKMIKMVYLP